MAGYPLRELPQPRRSGAPVLPDEKINQLLVSRPLPEVAFATAHNAGTETMPRVSALSRTLGRAAPKRCMPHFTPAVYVEQGRLH
eukprot:2231278-Pyramimonas_sp.AAC.1